MQGYTGIMVLYIDSASIALWYACAHLGDGIWLISGVLMTQLTIVMLTLIALNPILWSLAFIVWTSGQLVSVSITVCMVYLACATWSTLGCASYTNRQEHGVVPWQCKHSAVVCAYLGDINVLSIWEIISTCSVWLFACAARSTLAAVPVLHVGFTNLCILVQTRAWCCTSIM